MKKILLVFIGLLLILGMTSCSTSTGGSNQRITPPKAKVIPLEGKWKIIKVINTSDAKTSPEKWVGKTTVFSNKFVTIGDYILYNPTFKIRRVNPVDYLFYNHRSIGNEINLQSEEADVITVSGKDKFICEILEIDDNNALLEINNNNLLIRKVSDLANENTSKKIEIGGSGDRNGITKENIVRTGVLIGLKAPVYSENGGAIVKYDYRTLFIASKNRSLHPILETKDIFFPRKSGFWKMGVKTSTSINGLFDTIYSYNVLMSNLMSKANAKLDNKKNGSTVSETININYVGNDYVSIEQKNINKDKTLSKLKIIPIDSLPKLKAIKISDLIGNGGNSNIQLSNQNLVDEYKQKGDLILDEDGLSENLGLFRKTGHWYFEGRVNIIKDNKILNQNYRINLIPPDSMIFYDSLSLSWKDIKERVPDTIDAFTSPNKDLAIILRKSNKLSIYSIINNNLSRVALNQIKLKPNEKVVMAEWATGSYVDSWEQLFSTIK